jgi:hypothetical protein
MTVRTQSPNVWVVQRHGAGGAAVGGPITLTAPYNAGLGVGTDRDFGVLPVPLAGGGYAVVWGRLVTEALRYTPEVYQVMTQAFDATGHPLGAPFAGSTTAVRNITIFASRFPAIAPLVGGGYVIAFSGEVGDVNVQRFNADSTAAIAPLQVAPRDAAYIEVVGTSTGGYMVTWADGNNFYPEGSVRAYSAADTPMGPAVPAGAGPNPSQLPTGIAPLKGGGAVLAWDRLTSYQYVFVEPLAPDATAIAQSRVVDVDNPAPPTTAHGAGSVAGLADGGYVVAWTEGDSAPTGGPGGEIHARRFAANGSPAGGETRINLGTTSSLQAGVVALPGGGFIVTWSGIGPDGARHSYERAFSATDLLGTP